MAGFVVLVIFGSILFGAMALNARARETRTYGPRVAREYFRRRFKLLALGIAFGALQYTASKAGITWLPQARNVTFLTFAAVQCFFFLRWRSTRDDAGELLLDLQRPRDWKARLGFGVLLGALGLMQLGDIYFTNKSPLGVVALAAALLLSSASLVGSALIHLELRSDGLVRFPQVHSWDDIVAFRFEPTRRSVLSLIRHHKLWSLEQDLHLPIARGCEKDVERVLLSNGLVHDETGVLAKQLLEDD